MSEHTYEVRISGQLDEADLVEELVGVEAVGHEVTTVLSGTFEDQESLSAFLRRLRVHGLEVLEIRQVPETEDDAAEGR